MAHGFKLRIKNERNSGRDQHLFLNFVEDIQSHAGSALKIYNGANQ